MTRLIILVIGALCLMAACSTERSARRNEASHSMPPGDLHIVVGQTGGFAGRMRGYSIRADGRVWRWEGKYVEENVLAEGTAPPAQIDSLWQRVQASDFFAQREQAREQAAFLSITADGESRQVSWAVAPADSATSPVAQLYRYSLARARAALRPSSDE